MAKDILARGGVRATFQTTGGGNAVSQKKWDDIFGDYKPEGYLQKGAKPAAEEILFAPPLPDDFDF